MSTDARERLSTRRHGGTRVSFSTSSEGRSSTVA